MGARGVHHQRFNCTYICNIAKNSIPVDLRTQMILKCKAFLFDHQISTYSKRNLPVNKTRKKLSLTTVSISYNNTMVYSRMWHGVISAMKTILTNRFYL